jgi:hypothetical protein
MPCLMMPCLMQNGCGVRRRPPPVGVTGSGCVHCTSQRDRSPADDPLCCTHARRGAAALGAMSYEYHERMAQMEQRRVGGQQTPLTTKSFLDSSEARLGATPGSNPDLDTKTGKGRHRPRGPGPDHMAGKSAGLPSPVASGVERDHSESAASAVYISSRGRMGKGRASPERDPVPGTTPAGFADFRHSWELRGVRSSAREAIVPKDHVVQREMGATWTPRKGSTSPTLEHHDSAAAKITLRREDVGKLSSMSPWQRPAAESDASTGSTEASWRQTGRPDVEPTSPQSRLSGSPKSPGQQHPPHMAASSDSPWSPAVESELAVASPRATAREENGYFASQALRDELLGLNLRALRERAAAAGLEKETVDDAIDLSEDPKGAVIALIVGATGAAPGNARELSYG